MFNLAQVQKLVNIHDKFKNNELSCSSAGEFKNLWEAIEGDEQLLMYILDHSLITEAMAIINPLTRDWAVDRYVGEII